MNDCLHLLSHQIDNCYLIYVAMGEYSLCLEKQGILIKHRLVYNQETEISGCFPTFQVQIFTQFIAQ